MRQAQARSAEQRRGHPTAPGTPQNPTERSALEGTRPSSRHDRGSGRRGRAEPAHDRRFGARPPAHRTIRASAPPHAPRAARARNSRAFGPSKQRVETRGGRRSRTPRGNRSVGIERAGFGIPEARVRQRASLSASPPRSLGGGAKGHATTPGLRRGTQPAGRAPCHSSQAKRRGPLPARCSSSAGRGQGTGIQPRPRPPAAPKRTWAGARELLRRGSTAPRPRGAGAEGEFGDRRAEGTPGHPRRQQRDGMGPGTLNRLNAGAGPGPGREALAT